ESIRSRARRGHTWKSGIHEVDSSVTMTHVRGFVDEVAHDREDEAQPTDRRGAPRGLLPCPVRSRLCGPGRLRRWRHGREWRRYEWRWVPWWRGHGWQWVPRGTRRFCLERLPWGAFLSRPHVSWSPLLRERRLLHRLRLRGRV